MENPYYSPNPAPVPTPTPTKNSNFKIIAGVFVAILLLLVGFIVFSLSKQSQNPTTETQVPNTGTNEEVANDPLDDEEIDVVESDTKIYSSENFNLTFHYPLAYGTTSTEYDDGEKNPRCTHEKITFSTSESEVYIYNDRELGAQTCVPAFGGTSVEGYTNTNAYGNSYSIAVLEVSGKFQAIGTEMLTGADETKFTTLFVTEGATEEAARDEIDALINKAEFDPEFK